MNGIKQYFLNIYKGGQSVLSGLGLSFSYMKKGHNRHKPMSISEKGYFSPEKAAVTIQYPRARIPVPDIGRYRLEMETDDCIGCDKCARICPVDCITIETFKASEVLGKTTDGTSKRLHLPVFDIDMAKCMFCGLCTTVCPTECLTMSKVYDYSVVDRDNLLFHYGKYSPEESEILKTEEKQKAELKKIEKEKEKAKDGGLKKKMPLFKKKESSNTEEKKSGPPKRKLPGFKFKGGSKKD